MARMGVLCLVVLVVIFSVFAPFAHAQITDDIATPTEGVGHDYIHLLSETVNLSNGSVSLRIDAPLPKGRGLTVPFAIGYDSNSVHHLRPGFYPNFGTVAWAANTGYFAQGGWSYVVPGVGNTEWDETDGNYPTFFTCNTWSNYVFRDPFGGLHSLRLGMQTSANGTCPNSPVTSGGDQQVTASLTNSSLPQPVKVSTTDGAVYQFAIVGASGPQGQSFALPSYIEDRNGNKVSVTSGASSFVFTDTAGRSVVAANGFGPSGTTNTVSFSGITYQITWKTVSASFSIPAPIWVGQAGGPDPNSDQCYPIPQANDAQVVISQITLPNGQKYKFYYGSDNPDPSLNNPYGLLSEIDYPTGGWVKYKWKFSDTPNELADYPGLISAAASTCSTDPSAYCPAPVKDGCLYQYKTPVVAWRQVGFGGTSPASTQTFTYSTS